MPSFHRRKLLLAGASFPLLLGPGLAATQSYPARQIRFIVPYGPGTVSDASARLLADKLKERWGQSLVVENLTGAGGVVGTQAIARGAPDGYTLGMLASNHAINAAVYPNLPYDPVADFKPIVHVTFNQFAFCVNSEVPANTLQEFIALAKRQPGKLNYGSSGNGGSPHLAVAKFAYMAGIDLMHIPYRSNGAAVTDLIAGSVALVSTSISALLPHVKNGRLKALAVSGDRRSPLMPEVPTVAEAGVPGYSMKNWNGIVAPAGLSRELVSQIQGDVVAILKDKSVQERVATLGAELDVLPSDAFERRLREEIVSWKDVVKAAGVKPM